MARYWVEVSDELTDSDPQWPAGLRPVKPATDGPPRGGARWWLFEDDGAPSEFEGKRVELTFTASYDGTEKTAVIADRRVLA